MILVLDTGIIGLLCHPKQTQAGPIAERLERRMGKERGLVVCLPEIADYELRRKLLHIGSISSLDRLDNFGRALRYLPLTTDVIRHAANLWAEGRRAGHPTASADSLDGDVILAAQALAIGGTVATTNRRHLERFVPVEDWSSP